MIELQAVWKTYEVAGQPLHVLSDIHESIPAGDYVAVMGPSGSGKSTLLNVLGCLDRPSAGSYRLNGVDVATLPEKELSKVRGHEIGFVFQSFHLVPRLTAAENVGLPMMLAGVPAAERAQRAAEALEGMGLGHRTGHRPSEMSGGERQRVAIARAMAMQPKILLGDEPTGNLDSRAGAHVIEILESLNQAGITLVIVTHDPGVARRAKRVLLVRDGRIQQRVAGTDLPPQPLAALAPAPG